MSDVLYDKVRAVELRDGTVRLLDQRVLPGTLRYETYTSASEVARAWFEENRYQDYLYLHGLSVEMAEAMAEYVHKRIRAELGFAAEDDRDMEKMLGQAYRGSRYSFGYPACPRLEDQVPILRLLDAGRIGVTLTDEFQLDPEQSTSALVVLNPKAKYFSV